jgi:predicted amidophosphoribosyltransferase
MSSDLRRIGELLEGVPGFGGCPRCQYLQGGTAALCFACARRGMDPLAPPAERCDVCDLTLAPGDLVCRNAICGFGDRHFERNYAIALKSRVLETGIQRFKYEGKYGWKLIFGRVLAGFLLREPAFAEIDLITASPSFPEPGRYDHARLVLEVAAAETTGIRGWEFDIVGDPVIRKISATPRMVGKTWKERRENAEGPLRRALEVTDPSRTRGRVIIVYDDVFTTGHTLREVARRLKLDGGAAKVYGVSLARQSFRGR